MSIPTRDDGANELHWARLVQPLSGKEWGYYFLPEVGDQVLLAFENGNIEKPYVIGGVPLDNNKFLTGSVDANNKIKRIVTKHGSTIVFEDNAQDEKGGQDKIIIQTAGKEHTIEMDNGGDQITIKDQKGNNSIVIATAEGQGSITIKAESRLTIKVGDTIKLDMSGESGTVKLSANDFKVEASKMASVQTDGMLKLEGSTVTEKASSVLKLESSGAATMTGSPIKIG
ncbi:phage baseplate assembly protein V [Agathobaculum sp. LCP25S3_E8]|uniref:phage baseplate assembly protein V n=1 Tax=Agathobaculum sp. LCP25S3_E8 TaxID=3438735 RepID=UPI003F8EF05E